MDINNKKILFVCTDCDLSNLLYHGIRHDFKIQKVIFEGKEPRKTILKRRVKKLGIWNVISQVIFLLTVPKWLAFISKKRVRRILDKYCTSIDPIPSGETETVFSVNDAATIEKINSYKADLILINGTRILSKSFLAKVACPVVNVHAGITPCYRGVHGAYWALVNDDAAHCGVTIHLVDTGIDTGGVLARAIIKTEVNDNFYTYPYIQFSEAIPLLKESIARLLSGQKQLLPTATCESRLWYHPGFFQYFYYRLVKKVA